MIRSSESGGNLGKCPNEHHNHLCKHHCDLRAWLNMAREIVTCHHRAHDPALFHTTMYPTDNLPFVNATWELDAVTPLRIPTKDFSSKLGPRPPGRRTRSDGSLTFSLLEHDAKKPYPHKIDLTRSAPAENAQQSLLSNSSFASSSTSSTRLSDVSGSARMEFKYTSHSHAASFSISKAIRPLPLAPLPPSPPSTPPQSLLDIRLSRPLPPPPVPLKDATGLPQLPAINANGLPVGCAAPQLRSCLSSQNDVVKTIPSSSSSDTSSFSSDEISNINQFMNWPLSDMEATFQRPIFVKTVVTGVFPREEDSDEGSDAGEDKDGVKEYQLHWIPPPSRSLQRPVIGKRYSKRWLREKAGRRREVEDYATVLRALRTLR